MSASRVCPRCNLIHDDVAPNDKKYQICNRCLDEMDDVYGSIDEDGTDWLKKQYDFEADDHNFRAARERR